MNDRSTQSASTNLRSLVLIVAAISLASWLVSERFLLLFSPRLLWQFILAIVLLIIMAWGYQPRRTEFSVIEHNRANPLSFTQIMGVGLPLCIATLISSANDLSNSVILDSVMLQPAASNSRDAVPESTSRDILDWAELMASNSDPRVIDGKMADVVGAVFHDTSLAPNQLLIVRWRVSGQVIDGQPVGIIVQVGNASSLDDGTWIRITGQFRAQFVKGGLFPVLVASESHLFQPPEPPYIYR